MGPSQTSEVYFGSQAEKVWEPLNVKPILIKFFAVLCEAVHQFVAWSQLLYTCLSASQPAETQDAESAFGSDCSSVLDWKPAEPKPPAPTIRKALSAINVQVRERQRIRWMRVYPFDDRR